MAKKLSLFLTALFLSVSLCGCHQAPKSQLSDDIYIFFTSDVHCGFDENMPLENAKALIDDTRAEHPNTALVDSGDYLQGGALGSLTKGKAVIEVMNAMGYDAATLGNHEFDYGLERLKELCEMADFPITICNVQYSGTKENLLKDLPKYVMKEFEGVKVAFIGITTPNVPRTSSPKYFMEDGKFAYNFFDGEDGLALAQRVQETVDQARADGADYVIALSHLGWIKDFAPYDTISLIHHTNGIDAVLDGHSHAAAIGTPYPNKDGEDVLLSCAGTKMENIGELIIGTDGTISAVLFSQYDRADEAMKQKIEEVQGEVNEILKTKIGTAEANMPITDKNGIRIVRCRETGIGDLICDCYRESLGMDIALQNAGGIRSAIDAGDITYGDVLNVMPFMNSLAAVKASGQQILDALEFGARYTESIASFEDNEVGASGAFLQVSGLKYSIDPSIPSGVVMDEDGMMVSIEGERRVKDVFVLENGKYVPIDPDKYYTVGGLDYVINGNGDGNTAFDGCEVLLADGMTDSDVFADYIREHSPISASYAEPDGRITIITK